MAGRPYACPHALALSQNASSWVALEIDRRSQETNNKKEQENISTKRQRLLGEAVKPRFSKFTSIFRIQKPHATTPSYLPYEREIACVWQANAVGVLAVEMDSSL